MLRLEKLEKYFEIKAMVDTIIDTIWTIESISELEEFYLKNFDHPDFTQNDCDIIELNYYNRLSVLEEELEKSWFEYFTSPIE